MTGYPVAAFVVCGAAAAVASAAQLAQAYPRWPTTDGQFGRRWLGIIVLDGLSGVAALAIVQALNLPEQNAWLAGVLGWIIVGLLAALVVRANLLTFSIGMVSVPLGFGVIYGALRSLLEPGIVARQWELVDAERDGRLVWSLSRADALAGTLTLSKVEAKLRDYVSTALATNPGGAEVLRRMNLAIASATKDTSAGELEAIKQLITYMVGEGFRAPLNNLLGRPAKRDMRRWRNGPQA
jgi:hypothetical protein